MLTDKCKEDFHKWYEIYIRNNRSDYGKFSFESLLRKFNRMHLSMQWGVYQDFFNQVNIDEGYKMLGTVNMGYDRFVYEYRGNIQLFITMNKGREKALEEANKLYNIYKNAKQL